MRGVGGHAGPLVLSAERRGHEVSTEGARAADRSAAGGRRPGPAGRSRHRFLRRALRLPAARRRRALRRRLPGRRAGRRQPAGHHPTGRPGRASSPKRPAAHGRGGERRGLLLLRRHPTGAPVDPPAVRVRPDLHDPPRRLRDAAGQHRPGADDLLLLRPRWPERHLIRSTHLAAAACPPKPVLQPRLRLGGLRRVRHLPGRPRRKGPGAAHRRAGLRRRGHHRRRTGRASSSPRTGTATWSSTR